MASHTSLHGILHIRNSSRFVTVGQVLNKREGGKHHNMYHVLQCVYSSVEIWCLYYISHLQKCTHAQYYWSLLDYVSSNSISVPSLYILMTFHDIISLYDRLSCSFSSLVYIQLHHTNHNKQRYQYTCQYKTIAFLPT